jgi:hypothetical protein
MDIPLFVLVVVSVHLSGVAAERRGRSFRKWAWTAAAVGPLAIPLLYLLPNRGNATG